MITLNMQHLSVSTPALRGKPDTLFGDVVNYSDHDLEIVADNQGTGRAPCVTDTSAHLPIVLNCWGEHENDSKARHQWLAHLPHQPEIRSRRR
ncbi:MAG: hypothetical protein KA117_00070 [Verrucomicrobia bacterium]|nr:hypothetical protein [Verrucomicrobiota bacterium]HNW06468.1 hypothetical protein [Verrucomicrobiota bacterium]HNZ75685.1 hypothetical protein [Verrucomicrobiota bacterium]HOC50716.1 hypothetical protein [Verrucomicrobiota bacterium]HOH39887.1 hypothetical protein [Verrucomicrobiota bacterium]